MIGKEQLLASMRHETGVIKHLASKVRPEALDWRPTPKQRSTRELLAYMTQMALSPTLYCLKGNWEHAPGLAKEAERSTPEGFAGAMDRQLARIEEALADLDEEAAADRAAALPWGTPTTQAAALMDTALKAFVAYRMQLFLYAKQSGSAELGSFDCWAGKPPA